MDYTDSSHYINREISWLSFNERVLEEAEDPINPLLERLKFLAIFANNLDEFFMVRVSGLKELESAGYQKPDSAGLTPTEQLDAIARITHELIERQYAIFHQEIQPTMRENLILIKKASDANDQELAHMEQVFADLIMPVLTPLAVDQGRPFPLISDRSLNIGVVLQKEHKKHRAFIQVPSVLPRLIELPTTDATQSFILIEDVIMRHMSDLFIGYEVESAGLFRITRNADLSIDEEDAHDLLVEIEKQVLQRIWGKPVRLEISKFFDQTLADMLLQELELSEQDLYRIPGIINHASFMDFPSRVKNNRSLMNKSLRPVAMPDFGDPNRIFSKLKQKDRLLHVPYQSFTPVINLLKAAATDPKVLAIKQTLYRVSGDSPVIKWLMRAAQNKKQVTVVVELKARFDEEKNIEWARKLEQAGCHVIYGLPGLKIHCKLLMVIRKESSGIVRYVHIGTGNYNDRTARLYTDMGLFTVHEAFGKDVSALFNFLTGYTAPPELSKLIASPTSFRTFIENRLNAEIAHAKAGRHACFIGKMNSLSDPGIIAKLYEASSKGVKIRLIVRGVNCLKSGVPGLSENIRVKSIVGRFLEHTRIYLFENGGNRKLYIGSPDLMERNINRRIETICPIEDKDIGKRIRKVLDLQFDDNQKSRIQKSDGTYTCAYQNEKRDINAQHEIYKYTKRLKR